MKTYRDLCLTGDISESHAKELRLVNGRNLTNPKVSSCVERVRNTINCGTCGRNQMAVYQQFWRDLQLYNLHEALLYASDYEKQGEYKAGTSIEAANVAFTYLSLDLIKLEEISDA